MTLGAKRILFTRLSAGGAGLVAKAQSLGLEPAWDQVTRTDEQAEINALSPEDRDELATLLGQHEKFEALAVAIANNTRAKSPKLTCHRFGLAADVLLYRDGVYLTATADYEPLGVWWEAQHELARWGGRFREPPDGNHFSIEHAGVK